MGTPLDHFSTYQPAEPSVPHLEERFEHFLTALDAGFDTAITQQWEDLSNDVAGWCAWASLTFNLATDDPTCQARRERGSALETVMRRLNVALQARLTQPDLRPATLLHFGERILAGWEVDAACFSPDLAEDLPVEKRLVSDFIGIGAKGSGTVGGTTYRLPALRAFQLHPDRAIREEAERASWGFWSAQSSELDTLYDDLVHLRTRMARKLDHPTHTPMGYDRMGRTDFGPEDVAVFRQEIIDHVVPLAAEYRVRQASALGIDRVRVWDEALHDLQPAPKPVDLPNRLVKVLADVHPALAEHYEGMRARGLLDLTPREGKGGGGFATLLEGRKTPFIFGNLNGTTQDLTLMLHELGHAYQLSTTARHQPHSDNWMPTADTAEVHSMSLELLALDAVGAAFDDEEAADAYRKHHLVDAVLILPYTACIDHFQHEVFANPELTPDERAAVWTRLEQTYMPWRDEPDLPMHPNGRVWQRQGHLYFAPFYYIDYALARTCSLQLWQKAQTDPTSTLDAYLDLCRRGGSIGLREVAQHADIRSPFEPGCLAAVAEHIRPYMT